MTGNAAVVRGSKGMRRDDIISNSTERYRRFLDVQDEIAGKVVASSHLTNDLVRERLSAGVPLLVLDDFFPSWTQAEPAFRRVAGWTVGAGAGLRKDELERAAAGVGEALYRELALVWYGGELTSLSSPQAGPELVAVVGASLRPFIKAHARLVMPLVEQTLWRRRHCPVCGGRPDLGYLDREQGARWLVCWRCDSEWQYKRLGCPYCGTEDPAKLAYLTDDAGKYRLYLCDACRAYMKAIDMRKAQQGVSLCLERFLTMHMDQQATAKGYLPGC